MLKKKMFKWAVVPAIAAIAFVSLNSFTGEGESSGGGKKCFNLTTLSCGSIPSPWGNIPLGDRTFCQVTGNKTSESCTETDCFGQSSNVACF
ncbi:hypothetical protein ACLOAU_03820 [Niabella sp. CJ426]|uniref:hypothetical protein n=1 Tax=Niabella sp. CJ426 TaxID=3393740 RepID=UPI003D086605